jgi:hypothetical protein
MNTLKTIALALITSLALTVASGCGSSKQSPPTTQDSVPLPVHHATKGPPVKQDK